MSEEQSTKAREGAILVYHGGEGWVALQAGSAGQVLTSNGEAEPTWVAQPKQAYGTHTNIPAAASVPDGSIYAETDTHNTYQNQLVATVPTWVMIGQVTA